MMLANDDFNVYADVAGASENFQDASDGGQATFGIAFDFDVYDCAIQFRQADTAAGERFFFSSGAEFRAQFGSEFVTGWNQNFVEDARVVRKDDVAVRAITKQSHESGMLAFDDLNDAAFGASVGTAACDAGEDAVAVHRVTQIVASDEEIPFDSRDRRIGDEEGVAVTMRDNSSGDEIGILSPFRYRGESRLLVVGAALLGNFLGS